MIVKNNEAVTIHIVGVGGQGALTLAKVIGKAALDKDVNIVITEVHGMAQRGGVVQTTIRLGKVNSPLPFNSDINLLLGFEPLEVYRARDKITPLTHVICNTDPIYPTTVSSGGKEYPKTEDIIHELKQHAKGLTILSANEKAAETGNPRVANIVLLGALAATSILPFTKNELENAIRKTVPNRALEPNIRGFELGYETA